MLVRQKGGGWVGEIQAQVGKEEGLVALDGEQAEAVLVMDYLHKGGMGMQRIGGIDARGVRQAWQDGFGDGNLIGFLGFRAPGARFPGCSAVPAPRSTFPSRATASSSVWGRLLCTQAASTTSIACASKSGKR